MATSTPYSNQGIFGQGAGELLDYAQSLIDQGVPQDVVTKLLQASSTPEQMQQGLLQAAASGSFGTGTPNYNPQEVARQQAAAQIASQQDAVNNRFGNDMAWQDPAFYRQAVGVTPVTTQDALQFGTTADPYAEALQRQSIEGLLQRANAGPSAGEQSALGSQRQAIDQLFATANRGATPDERNALDTQMGAARSLLQRAGQGATPEEAAAIGDQRRMMNSLFGDYQKGASDVELETQDDQRKAIAELMGIYSGGGENAVARAQRAQARADQEDWVRGQREAQMQDLAERGMSGSGAELASLAQDRQAAASRLSMADLQTQADLEKSAMQALLNSAGVAGQMQQGEGAIQARRLQQLQGASNAAQGITGALGNIEGRSANELASGGGMAGDVASGYGAIQNRSLNALQGANQGAASLASNYGNIESRAIQALLGAQSGASQMRSAADQYVSGNADRMSDAAIFNANAINNAASEGKQFMQQAWQDMINNRTNWDMQTRNLQTDVAQGLLGTDVGESQYGYGTGLDIASTDTAARNRAQQNYNTSNLGVYTGTAPVIYDAQNEQAQAQTAGLRTGGQTIQQAGNAVLNYYTGGMGGMAQSAQQQQQQPYPQYAQNMASNPWIQGARY